MGLKTRDEWWEWYKPSADAKDAVADGFGIVEDDMMRPDGQATIFMNPDQLELTLVAYGLGRLAEAEKGNRAAQQEVHNVDQILRKFDDAVGRER